MSLRILHILDHSLPLHSGYSFRTMSILREQRALGWETLQLTSPKQGATDLLDESVEGWRFFRTPNRNSIWANVPIASYLDLMSVTEKRIDQIVERERPNLLQAHSPILNAFPAFRVGRRRGIPVVYEMRSSWEDAAVDHGTTREGSMRYQVSRALETLALKRAGHITTICDGLRTEIIGRGVSGNKVTVIPNAVDTHLFKYGQTADPALVQRLGLGGYTVLGFAGSFYGYEGLDLLVDGLTSVLKVRPNTKLLLVGGGFQEEALRRQVEQLKLKDHVVFVGRVPHSEVQHYYNLIDVLVYPRRSMRLTDMVTPLKPLEAMAQGRLLVASDVGGHKELIRHGITGFLFQAGDSLALATAVLDLLGKPELWDDIRRAGRMFVEAERTWTRSVAGYIDVYRRLLPEQAAMIQSRAN